jgi:hypothetical protein
LVEEVEGIKIVPMGVEAGTLLTHQSMITAPQKSPCPAAGTTATFPDLSFAIGFHLNKTHVTLYDLGHI